MHRDRRPVVDLLGDFSRFLSFVTGEQTRLSPLNYQKHTP